MSDLDDLMQKLAELDAKDVGLWVDKDIDLVIAYQRKFRAQKEAGGVKPKKGASDAPKAKLDLAALGLIKKPEPMIRRKI